MVAVMRWMILVGLLLVACGDDDGGADVGRDTAPDTSMDSAVDSAVEDAGDIDTGSEDSGSDTGGEDSGGGDTGSADAMTDAADAMTDASDAMTDAMSTEDICSFNSDCIPTERCECDGECACRIGTRGTGAAGVDMCTDGNDCASSVCAEGNGGVFYCSGECDTAADCGPELPRCIDVAFVGRICARDPG